MNKLARIIELSQRRAREGHLGVWRQLGEMALLRVLHGVGPGYYHTAGFWRRELGWADKTSQLSDKEYRRRVAVLNPIQYRKLSQNKIPEKAILTLFDIPTARFWGRLNAHTGVDAAGGSFRSAPDLVRLVQKQRASRLVFKPLEGWSGKGIHIPEINFGENVTFCEPGESNVREAEDYCRDTLKLDKGGDWIVEEYFHQHPVLSALNPTSVNTVRIWVMAPPEPGECQVLLAFLRMGRAGMVIDNVSSGGIAAPINLASGRLAPARDYLAGYNVYPRHPDHGALIEGVVLPCWPDVQRLAVKALSVFPGLRFAGLDVAIGVFGPVIQELNVCPDHDNAAITDCPSAKLLRIE